MREFCNSQGQALLEVLVALTVIIVVSTTFIALAVTSVRNSVFSKNQAIATQLGQEGLEGVITIRDQNTTCPLDPANCAVRGPSLTQWTDLYVPPNTYICGVGTNDLKAVCSGDFILFLCTPVGSTIEQPCLVASASSYDNPDWQVGGNTSFSRKVRISETGVAGEETTIKNVTVFVWWTDAQGVHSSVLVRKLQKNRLD